MTTIHRLVQAWQFDPVLRESQLTHAAEPGHQHALCGVLVMAWGDDWEPTAMRRRCPVCAQGAQHGAGY
jgi:hypothetical protein